MANYRKKIDPDDYFMAETQFNQLMKKRILKVLIICSSYDYFILEEDGRIDEQLFNEYIKLNQRYPPEFVQVPSSVEAFKILGEEKIDLVITMLSAVDMDSFVLAKLIKQKYPQKPIVILTPFSREVSVRLTKHDLSAIDYVFCWLGNAGILMAIVKLIEDKMNAEFDIHNIGVQALLLVEDSVRFYSSYLPILYEVIFKQSVTFQQEGLNEHQRMLRMRGRPKILLARDYNEAIQLYQKYKNNLLGVISDMSYKRDGLVDEFAGIKLCRKIKEDDRYMPLLLQSSNESNRQIAYETRVGFIHKYSKTLLQDITNFVVEYFAFGDFVFKDPDTNTEIARASDLKEVQKRILEIPDKCLLYHVNRNHFSKWINARALFPIGTVFKKVSEQDFSNTNEVRTFLYRTIQRFRTERGRGIIAKFYRERYDESIVFTRIGDGSIGGKARGLAFVDSIIKRYDLENKFENVTVAIPLTVVLSTEVFDQFMAENQLHAIANSDLSDEAMLQHFSNACLPKWVYDDLRAFISVVKNPLAIRSSSLLEDSHYQPFAGVYSTYMIANTDPNPDVNLRQIGEAIKCVYASVYFKGTKAYMAATSNVIDQEKMGIVIQEVCGTKYGKRYYPTISGVARSVNFYPIEAEKPEEGIANIALGLGKYVVEGSKTLRFSPKYPQKVLQLSNAKMALLETQKHFKALDLNSDKFSPDVDEGVNIVDLKISDAEADNSINHIVSTYDYENDILRDGLNYTGKRLITFANILKYNIFPLADILKELLRICQLEMNNPVEIEFAVNLNVPNGQPRLFNLLQIRPIVDSDQLLDGEITGYDQENTVIISHSVLGNGLIKGIHDIIYVKPETFNSINNQKIVPVLEKINDSFLKTGRNYILIGPGRWGSSDHWLGVPVKWSQICASRLIIESNLTNYRIDPSQGTHFFQNLTSFRVGYFTINPYMNDGWYDVDFLNSQSAVYEDEYIRHVHFENPMVIKIDSQKNLGVVMKPQPVENIKIEESK